MTLTIPLSDSGGRHTHLQGWRFGGLTKLDVILASILLGPLTVLQIAGRTPSVYWVDVIVAVFAIGAFAKTCVRPDEGSFRLPRVAVWAIAYALLGAASMVLSDDLLASIALLKLRIVPIAVFFLTIRTIGTKTKIENCFRNIVVFGCVLAAIGLYNWYMFASGLQVLGEEYGPKDMLQLSFGRSNYLASMFVLIIPIGVAFIRMRKGRLSSIAFLGALLLVTIALVFTQSRGALISLSLGFMAWGLLSLFRSFSGRKVAATAMTIGLVLASAPFFWGKMPEDVRVGLETAFNLWWSEARLGNYGGGRTELWVAAVRGAWQSNFLGIGLGNEAIYYSQAGLTQSAHNLYLETLLQTGIVGFVLLMGVLFGFGATLWRLWKKSPAADRPLVGAVLATFVIALVNNAQEPSFWGPQYSCLFWMLMGACYSWRRLLPSTQPPQRIPI